MTTISRGYHHGISSFLDTAWEVVLLQMLYLFLCFMSQKRQSFSCSLSHSSLKHPPRYGSLDHVVDAANMIGRRPIVDDHMHMPKL
jgi:hypothetical protein